MNWLAAVFLAGAVLIWTGLAHPSQAEQLVGETVCVAGFAWPALGGWHGMCRRVRRMRDGADE
jgi:hypothetical protein